MEELQRHSQFARLLELAGIFLRLGATSFGGPAAHIALMERELVRRRAWLERQDFLDLMGATNLIPGPNSTELAMHIGQKRAGWPGLVVAGVAFIAPAALLVTIFATLYVRFERLPQIGWILTGVQPVVIAIIAHALWKLGKAALKNVFTVAVAGLCGILVAAGINEVLTIFLAALIGLVWSWKSAPPAKPRAVKSTFSSRSAPAFLWLGAAPALAPELAQLFLVFLKIGSVVYGSGYVLLAFLRADFVDKFGWISSRQLLDAIAVGQITPGPLFTSATFIGYLLHGVPGALVATLGIFLPAFVFVALLAAGLERWRSSPRARIFLDAVNAASLALMAIVTFQLAHASIADGGWIFTTIASLLALAILGATKLNAMWLLLAGALAGYWLHL